MNNPSGKWALLITGYNRPAYFSRQLACLESLVPPADLEIILYLDGGENSAAAEYQKLARTSCLANIITVRPQPGHLGIGVCKYEALKFVFEDLGYDRVLYLEDDILILPSYAVVLDRLYTWLAQRFKNIGCVSSTTCCPLSRQEKLKYLKIAGDTGCRLDNYLMPRSTWNLVKPLVQTATERFYRDTVYSEIQVEEFRAWMRDLLPQMPEFHGENILAPQWNPREYFANNPPVSPDALLSFALKMNGLVFVSTRVNRALHIGRHGTHCTEYHWLKYYLDTTPDHFLEDINLKEFELSQP